MLSFYCLKLILYYLKKYIYLTKYLKKQNIFRLLVALACLDNIFILVIIMDYTLLKGKLLFRLFFEISIALDLNSYLKNLDCKKCNISLIYFIYKSVNSI